MKGVNRVKTKAKDFWHDFLVVLRRSDMVILPGNIAFFLILAIIPFIGLITYGASMLNLSTTYLYDFIAHSFSTDIADLVLGVNLSNSANFFITLVFGLYIASNGADSIITASNTIYGVEHNSWMRRRWKAFWMTLLIVILLIFMLIVPVFGNNIVSLVKEVNLNGNITSRIISIYDLLKGPISWFVIFIIVRIIYKIAPDKKPKRRVINYGALFTTVMWIIVTRIYSEYVTNYASYTDLFGGVASIVVLMIWIYMLSYIFTVGIALNNQKDEEILSKTGTIEIEE